MTNPNLVRTHFDFKLKTLTENSRTLIRKVSENFAKNLNFLIIFGG